MKARSVRTPINSREEIRAGLRYLWHLPRAGGCSASLSCHLIHSDTASSCSPPPVRIWGDFPLNTQQHTGVIASAEAIMWQPAFLSGFVVQNYLKKLFADHNYIFRKWWTLWRFSWCCRFWRDLDIWSSKGQELMPLYSYTTGASHNMAGIKLLGGLCSLPS